MATDNITGVDFTLARNGAVSGIIADPDGAPVAGVSVVVADDAGSFTDVTDVTDADGAYGVGALPAVTYVITPTLPDGYSSSAPTS